MQFLQQLVAYLPIDEVMHKISAYSVQLAKNHAQKAQEHGRSIETCGKTLQQRDENEAHGHFIEEYGKVVQEYAYQSLLYAQALEEDVHPATELYGKTVEAHVCATQAHIQAVTAYTQLIQERLKVTRKALGERTEQVTRDP